MIKFVITCVINQPRQIYACGHAKFHKYSRLTLPLHPWLPEVKEDADRIAKEFGFISDGCLLNEYKDGSQYVGYHADKEGQNKFIKEVYTLSLGATRAFNLKHNTTGKLVKVNLNSGDLCVMLGKCQSEWQHTIPKRANAGYRISETFRLLGT